jgi:hypothetical protein
MYTLEINDPYLADALEQRELLFGIIFSVAFVMIFKILLPRFPFLNREYITTAFFYHSFTCHPSPLVQQHAVYPHLVML